MLLYKQTWDQRTSITSSEIVLYVLCVRADVRLSPWQEMTPLNTPVHSSITHNSQEKEATQASIDGWMDKENVVYT